MLSDGYPIKTAVISVGESLSLFSFHIPAGLGRYLGGEENKRLSKILNNSVRTYFGSVEECEVGWFENEKAEHAGNNKRIGFGFSGPALPLCG